MQDSRRILDALFTPGRGVIELTGIGTLGKPRTIATGYFNTVESAMQAIPALESHNGCYFGINPLDPALLDLAPNTLRKGISRPTDAHVLRLQTLFVDLDVVTPVKGVCSTDEEKARAFECAGRIVSEMTKRGWPLPIRGDSGNGAHLLWRIDLPNDPAHVVLLRQTLAAFDKGWSDASVKVDRTTFNPSRLCKLYGTTVRKGEPTEERPHRKSRLLGIPDPLEIVTREQLTAFAAQAQADPPKRPKPFPVPPSLPRQESEIGLIRSFVLYSGDEDGKTKHFLQCPWFDEHTTQDGARDACVFENADGSIGFNCFHDHCRDRTWADVKARLGLIPGRATFPPDIGAITFDPGATPDQELFSRLLEDSSHFKGVWTRKRKLKSHYAYNRELARAALSHQWPVQQVVNLLIAYNSKYGYLREDRLRPYFYQKLIHSVRSETVRADERDKTLSELLNDLQSEDRVEEKKEILKEILGIGDFRICEYVGTEEYLIEINGKAIEADIESVISNGALRRKVAHLCRLFLPKFRENQWSIIAQGLLACVDEEILPEETGEKGLVKTMVTNYLMTQPTIHTPKNHTPEEIDSLAERKEPFRLNGRIHFSLEPFRNFWLNSSGMGLPKKNLGILMSQVGFGSEAIHTVIRGRRTTRNHFVLSEDLEIELLGHILTTEEDCDK